MGKTVEHAPKIKSLFYCNMLRLQVHVGQVLAEVSQFIVIEFYEIGFTGMSFEDGKIVHVLVVSTYKLVTPHHNHAYFAACDGS